MKLRCHSLLILHSVSPTLSAFLHIPEHIIEEVRSHSDIVDVIGEHVRLQKRGKNFLGLCPFHTEKTPSFNVNPELGIYKCFGCGKSGNAISFVMEHNGLPFVEAMKFLAHRAGMTLELEEKNSAEKEQESRTERAYKVLHAAQSYYAAQLQNQSGAGTRSYFLKRGFTENIINAFGLGHAPDDWQTTMNELLRQGYSQQSLEDAGLIIVRDDGKVYDRFRGRAMFAIHDVMGRVIGFGARILSDAKDQPKYINSPQSLVYDKSKVLYGLYQAKQNIRQEDVAILTEGYADTITLHQYGFTNAVASSGTSLTKEQLQLLARYTKRLAIVYDGDPAGINAAMRGVELALTEGFDVSIVTLPNREDPDSFVRNQGAEAFRTYLRNAPTFIDYMAEQYKAQGMMQTPRGQAEAIRSIVKLITLVGDALHREFLIRSIAQKFSLHEQLLYDELRLIAPQQAPERMQEIVPKRQWVPEQEWKQRKRSGQRKEQLPPPEKIEIKRSSIKPEERELLRVALLSPMGFGLMENSYGVSPETFLTPDAQSIYRALQHAHHHAVEIAGHLMTNESLSAECRNIVSDLLFAQDQVSTQWERFNIEITPVDVKRTVEDSLLRLRVTAASEELSALQQHLRETPEDLQILQRIMELSRARMKMEMQMRGIEEEEH